MAENLTDPEDLFIDGPEDTPASASVIPEVDIVKPRMDPQPAAAQQAAVPAPVQAQAVAQAPVAVQAAPPQMQQVPVQQQHEAETNELLAGDNKVTSMQNTFFNALSADKQAAFIKQAKPVLREFLKDDNQITNFGIDVLNDVNATVNQILEEEKKAKIPEIDDILENANRELDDFNKKNHKAREEAEKKQNWLTQFIAGSKRAAEDYAFNAQDLVKKFDVIDAKIIKQSNELARTYYQSKKLQEQNRQSANKMVGVLAMLEAVHMESLKQADILQNKLDSQTPNTPEWQTTSDRLRRVADVANAIEQQHANYMARLAIAWATTEQIRSSIRLSSELVRKLKMTSKTTIPSMKLVVAQIGQMNRMQKAGKSIEALQSAQDHVLDVYNKNMGETMPKLEAAAQKAPMSAEQVEKLAESVRKSNEDIVAAIRDGRKQRLEMEKAVLKAGQTIQKSSEEMGKQLVASLLGQDGIEDDGSSLDTASDFASGGYNPDSSSFGF